MSDNKIPMEIRLYIELNNLEDANKAQARLAKHSTWKTIEGVPDRCAVEVTFSLMAKADSMASNIRFALEKALSRLYKIVDVKRVKCSKRQGDEPWSGYFNIFDTTPFKAEQ